MKRFLTATLLCSALFITPATTIANAGTVNNEAQRGYISVSYTTEKKVSPDTVEISIAVKTDSKSSIKDASTKNKEISDKIYEYLKSVIDPANDDYVRTTNYSANPTYNYINGKRTFDKYEVSNNVIVHTKKIDKISQMIEKSLSLGATNVDSLSFSLAQKDQYCADLLSSATKNAKQRAEVIATAASTSITGIKSINTSCTVNAAPSPRYMYSNAKMLSLDSAGAAEAGGVGNIESGLVTIYSNVNADFFVK